MPTCGLCSSTLHTQANEKCPVKQINKLLEDKKSAARDKQIVDIVAALVKKIEDIRASAVSLQAAADPAVQLP